MSVKTQKLCFVLMPFKEDLKEVYTTAIKPACHKAGFVSLRVDELKGAFNINRKIIEYTFISDAIIADLTGWSPNVFYELGVAHAIDNKTIMIVQKQDALPFDISNYRCIIYDQTKAGLEKLSVAITEILMTIEQWRQYPSNPVQDFKPYDIFAPTSSTDKAKKKLIEKEMKFLDEEKLAADSSQIETPELKIFISHASEDKALARRLESELKTSGVDVWVDHAFIRAGDNLPERLSDAMNWCNTVLLLWSRYAAVSYWVGLEWTNALTLRKLIIPCLIDKTPVPAFLANTSYVEFTNLDKGVYELLHALKDRKVSRVIFTRLPDKVSPPIKKPLQDEPDSSSN